MDGSFGMKGLLEWNKNLKLLVLLWIAFYVYAITVGFLVQFLILPVMFPSAHWKDGLMVGGDWIQFHTEGLEIAKKVEEEGWSEWSLKHPVSGQAMSGIAGFFYALTGIHKSWVLLFYNAFLHATAGIVLFLILRLLGISQKLALIFSIPFVVFPTSLTWVSQIHKDGLYILGMYLTFLSIALAFSKNWRLNLVSLMAGSLGALLFFTVGRQYAIKITQYFYALFVLTALGLALFNLLRLKKEKVLNYGKALIIFSWVFLVYEALQPSQTQTQTQTQAQWYWNPYLPDKIENQFYRLAVWRNEIWAKHLSGMPGAIDEDIKFRSVEDFLKYTPRALFVGFFSPFPKFWFTQGSTTGGTIARYITPFEAIYLYIAWIIFPIALWINRGKPWFWLVLLMCLGFIWLHVVVEPNVGPIVRKRYGYIMLLSAIGYATFFELLRKRHGKDSVFF